ncbi:MAG: hypothetical protein KAR40_09615 [Candidatus Sabulitectum sp.]|nr:hypothetical protein [Candidatus Sabulitectum sp.]
MNIEDDLKNMKEAYRKAEKDGLIERRFTEGFNHDLLEELWFFIDGRKGSGVYGDVVYGDLI